jgi:PEP-CTERM motif
MHRKKLGLLLGLALAVVAGRAEAISIANGDLIVTLQKGGTELYVNLGDAFTANDNLDLSSAIASLSGFGGTLAGAKVVGIGVANPGRTVDFGFGPLPQENIIFTSLETNPLPENQAIEQAMNVTDTSAASSAWFWQLRSPTVGGSQSTGASSSYEGNLGFGTDAVANRFPFSTAGIIAGDGTLTIAVYSAVRGYEDFAGPARSIQAIGSLVFGPGDTLSYVPEPGTLLLVGAGLLGLAGIDRRTRRA